MSIFKRGNVYWYHFMWDGEHVQRSTKQGNPRTARNIEAAYRTRLAKGEVGIAEREPAPAFRAFAPRFTAAVESRSSDKQLTVTFYKSKLSRLLEYEPLASARLDRIDEDLIEKYVQKRLTAVAPGSVNRELATLRLLLGMAFEWKLIGRIPKVRKLPGERIRDFVLTREQERAYLEAAPQPLGDLALLILDTGLRVGEACALKWTDVQLDPQHGGKVGNIRIRAGKSKNARRVLSLTARVRGMLAARMLATESTWVFPGEGNGSFVATSFDHQHKKLRTNLGLPKDFVLHSLRHTMLTRLGEAGVDAFTIMRIAGHSSITVSQRYVHPSSEAMEGAFERLEAMNVSGRPQSDERRPPATVSATLGSEPVESVSIN
jgi:integrase